LNALSPQSHDPQGPAKAKRVNALFDKGGPIEMPIILQTEKGLWLIGGKTRLGTANLLKGIPAKVWMIGGEQGVAEGSEDPFGPQGRFVGDTGPAQITTTVARVQLKPGDKVLYKPTEQRARIEAMSRDGTQARIHIPSPMGGKTFNCKTSDLKALGALKEKSTSQAQFRTMAAAAHDPKFARKVGIKQSVAREFNRADKGQSYKSLPKKS